MDNGDSAAVERDSADDERELSRAVYDDQLDYSPWTLEEIGALADEAAALVAT